MAKAVSNGTDERNPDVLSGLPTRWCLVLVGLVILLATVALIVSSMFAIETIRLNSDGANGGGKRTPIIPANDSVKKPEKTEIDGLYLVKRAAWGAMDPTGFRPRLNVPVERVIISHTDSPACMSFKNCSYSVFSVQRYCIETLKFLDISYNFLVGGDGNAYEGAGWDTVGAHTFLYNSKSIGIGVIGKFHLYPPNEELVNATKNLIELGVKLGKISKNYTLNAWCQLKNSIAPGRFFVDIMEKWPNYAQNTPHQCTK